jgi:enoyl-CoA hydratase/carnithine racemase
VLAAHLAEVEARSEVRVLVLAGEGRHFCSGFDLASLGQVDAGARFGALADALERARPITIARLQGGAYGGAADLALACDFRLGVPACEVFVPAARVGLHFYGGGLAASSAAWGWAWPSGCCWPGRRWTPGTAGLWLSGRVAARRRRAGRRRGPARRDLLALAPLALLPMKQHLNALAAGRLDADRLAQDILRARDSADLVEGQAAWAARRPRASRGLKALAAATLPHDGK